MRELARERVDEVDHGAIRSASGFAFTPSGLGVRIPPRRVPRLPHAPARARGRTRPRARTCDAQPGRPCRAADASPAVSFACWDQALPPLTNTYAAPVWPPLNGAPMTTVSPLSATAAPKLSPPTASEAVRSACCDQPVPLRARIIAWPAAPALGAPMTAVLPSTETAKPNSAPESDPASSRCWTNNPDALASLELPSAKESASKTSPPRSFMEAWAATVEPRVRSPHARHSRLGAVRFLESTP